MCQLQLDVGGFLGGGGNYGVERHFQKYFSYIVAISFIGGGNQTTGRKQLTFHKSLTNFYILYS
jgi:hypothetical protein